MTADIRSLRGERGLVSAAKLAVLNVESNKAVLGVKWQRLEALVCALFEGAIKASLERGDVHLKSGELGYVVIYHRLPLREAQARCAELSRQVCRRLFAEGHIEVAIRTVVGYVDRGLLRTNPNMMAAIDQSLEQHGKKTLILPGRRGSASVPDVSASTDRAFSGPESGLAFAYRPIWDCTSRTIFAWLCQPSPRDRLASPFAGAADNASLSTEDADCALLDRTILAHCAKHMERLHRDGARLLLAVPIHASTLSRPHAWSLFGEIYRPIPPAVLRELVFVVFGLGAVPDTRLSQELSKLSGARRLFCVAQPGSDVGARFAQTRAHAIGVDAHAARGGKSSAELIASLAAEARQNGHDAFVLGLATPRRAISAMASGVRYLEGAAIHPIVADPRRALVRELDSLPVPRPA